jgi:hypothetical protein
MSRCDVDHSIFKPAANFPSQPTISYPEKARMSPSAEVLNGTKSVAAPSTAAPLNIQTKINLTGKVIASEFRH